MPSHDTPRASHPDTVAVSAGRPARSPDAPLNVPITPASTYVGTDGEAAWGYGREGNPGWEACEEVIGALEGGRALTFASGMAAAQAVLDLVPPGGVVVMPDGCYLGTAAAADIRAERGSLAVRRVAITDTAAVVAAASGADLVWVESPSNPMMEVADLRAVADAVAGGPRLAVDNTFATPLRQRPLDLGYDLVVHSATKFLAGHSDALMGAVVVRADDDETLARLHLTRSLGGAVPGVLESYLVLRGLRTLAVRLDRAEATARTLADRLGGHPAVRKVRYPGFGCVLSVDLADADSADAFVAGCRLAVFATSLGGVETTLERRRRWPKELDGVPDGLVRVSVGIENVDDLWDDLAGALGGSTPQ